MRLAGYTAEVWLEADVLLEREGFDRKDRETVLIAAKKNRQQPVEFAQAAIRLRRHVEAGKPLSV